MAANDKPTAMLQCFDQDLTPPADEQCFQVWLHRKRVVENAGPGSFAAIFPGFTTKDLPLTVHNCLKISDLEAEVAMRENKHLTQRLEEMTKKLEDMTTQLDQCQDQLEVTIEEWADVDADLYQRETAAQEEAMIETALAEEVHKLREELTKKDAQLVDKELRLRELKKMLASQNMQTAESNAQPSVRQHYTHMPYRSVSLASNAAGDENSTYANDENAEPPTKKATTGRR